MDQDNRIGEVGPEDEDYETENEAESATSNKRNKRNKRKKRGKERKHHGKVEAGDIKRVPEDYRAKYEALLETHGDLAEVNKGNLERIEFLQEKLDRHGTIVNSLKDSRMSVASGELGSRRKLHMYLWQRVLFNEGIQDVI